MSKPLNLVISNRSKYQDTRLYLLCYYWYCIHQIYRLCTPKVFWDVFFIAVISLFFSCFTLFQKKSLHEEIFSEIVQQLRKKGISALKKIILKNLGCTNNTILYLSVSYWRKNNDWAQKRLLNLDFCFFFDSIKKLNL